VDEQGPRVPVSDRVHSETRSQELREICSLSNVPALLDVPVQQSCSLAELADVKASRARARSFEILSQLKVAAGGEDEKGLRLRFNMRAVSLQGDAEGAVAAAEFEGTAAAASKVNIACGMFCRSIGYKLGPQVRLLTRALEQRSVYMATAAAFPAAVERR
jgi:hypothetical protein